MSQPSAQRDAVLFLAISCQELNEALRRKAEEADEQGIFAELASALIHAVKVCLDSVSTLNGAGTASTAAVESGSGARFDTISELATTLECIRSTCQDIQNQTLNYFGAFRKAIPLRDLGYLCGRLNALIEQLSLRPRVQNDIRSRSRSSSSGATLAGGFSALEVRDDTNDDVRAYALDPPHESDPEHAIKEVLSKLFWLRHFGKNCSHVAWRVFLAAFETEHGPQTQRVVDILKGAFGKTQSCGAARNWSAESSSSTSFGEQLRGDFNSDALPTPPLRENDTAAHSGDDVDSGIVVDLYTFDTVTSLHGGLHRAYQELCDPVTVVFEMGTVDDTTACVVSTPSLVGGLLGVSVKQICCGGQHAAVLSAEGKVFTWGRGGFGRLGHGSTDSDANPRVVQGRLKDRVCAQVACGFAYTAAVTSDGALYTWGAGENGRLGLGDTEDRHAPALVEELVHTPVKECFAGSVHTCVLTRLGQVYSFGKFEYTGHGRMGEDVLVPRLLDAFGDKCVAQISVGPGGYHTIALTADKEVFTWGHNRVGQLGYSNSDVLPRNGEGAHFLPTPRPVPGMRNCQVKSVVAGWGHTAVVTSTGELLVCGRNLQGQLGLGDPSSFPVNERNHPFQAHFAPVPLSRPTAITTAHSTAAATADIITPADASSTTVPDSAPAVAYADAAADLMTKSKSQTPSTTPLPHSLPKEQNCSSSSSSSSITYMSSSTSSSLSFAPGRAEQVACGGEHSACLTQGGEVYTFGAGSKGQLGHGTPLQNEHFPALLRTLKRTRREVYQVACGNNCTLVLAGRFTPPSLLQRCLEVVRASPVLMEMLETANLPQDLADQVRHTPDLSI